jgi:hypothetical protein
MVNRFISISGYVLARNIRRRAFVHLSFTFQVALTYVILEGCPTTLEIQYSFQNIAEEEKKPY